jgi:hypothetical protein
VSYEPVDIYFKEKGSPSTSLSGVVVRVMNQAGTLLYGQGTSDLDGKASFLLPNGTYQLRFFKRQVNFSNPQFVEVLEAPVAPQTNSFDVFGESFVPPISTDLRLCVASGFFRRPDGSAAANHDIHFITRFNPLLLEGAAMLTERVSVRTDTKGYVQISLVRCAQYDVTIEGFEDYTRTIEVPDKLQTNLPDLLFPVVASISFDPPPPFHVPVNGLLTVTPTVTTSDGRILEGTALGDVLWKLADYNTAGLGVSATQLILTAGAPAGSTQLLAERADQTIIRIPNTPILGVPASVVVP